MGLWDKLTGRERDAPPAANADEQAIERYRYLLRTAPPDQVERAHAEAFATLTPEQRQQVLQQLSADVPQEERADSDDPQALARMATRAEMRQPGTLERNLGGVGMGGVMAGSLLGPVAGAFIGTTIAMSLLGANDGDAAADNEAGDTGDTGDTGGGGDYAGGGHYAGGGDFGGGDFGGGDFGGGGI